MRNAQEIEISKCITKYNNNIHMIYPILRDKFLPQECKLAIYQTILMSIIMHSSEVWTLTAKTESIIQASERVEIDTRSNQKEIALEMLTLLTQFNCF